MNQLNFTDKKSTVKSTTVKKTKTTPSEIKKDSVWSPNCFTLFVVSKTTRKHGQNWVHYYLKDNKQQKYYCYEDAFLQRFTEMKNIY